ncbi:hypothetical protein Pd630_LPD09088 (plasmid) [Rhodococcus opacus PD630]|nr:hypothetical protein Pd630_LPD09088 [Rhodococcus opacus PD630]
MGGYQADCLCALIRFAIVTAHGGPQRGCFGVILNDLAAESTFPFDLGGWTIDRASTEEMNLIRPPMQALSQLATREHAPKYEASIETQHEGQAAFYHFNLPTDAWRYTVVRPGGEHMDERHKLTQALRICPLDLRIGGWADWQEDPHSAEVNFDFAETGHYFSRKWWTDPTPVIADFTRSREIYELRCALDDEKYPEITRALALFVQLDQLEDFMDAKLLGHFTVLESLLSHAPDKYDPVDSITRQLKRNLVLLDHRMPPNENLELDQFGQNATGEQVISKLYSIRSAAAHGGSNAQAVKWLNDRTPSGWSWSDNISGYVRKLTQRVLVAALREPRLVSDLRGT